MSRMRLAPIIMLFFLMSLLVGCTKEPLESYGEVHSYLCHLVDCDEIFIERLSGASSITCAFYDLDNKYIQRILIDTGAAVVVDEHQRGETPFMVREGDGLMHNKFCIINKSLVITGSYNPTTIGSYDNIITIDSLPIAKHYEEQFSQLLKARKHPSKHTSFLHNGAVVEAYACPQDSCAERLHERLRGAQTSILFSLFTFTDKELASILLEKHEQGLLVTGIIESFQSREYNQYYALQAAGLPIFLEDTPSLQHNKVFIIDGKIVITGSYNPTNAADTINDENIIVFHDADLARHYQALVEDTIKRTQSFK